MRRIEGCGVCRVGFVLVLVLIFILYVFFVGFIRSRVRDRAIGVCGSAMWCWKENFSGLLFLGRRSVE